MCIRGVFRGQGGEGDIAPPVLHTKVSYHVQIHCVLGACLGGRVEGACLGGRVEGACLGGRVEGAYLGGRVEGACGGGVFRGQGGGGDFLCPFMND